ncbi:hypothetical protein [Leisingera caerulea]|uniref:hypothetical protein n=1 Tax=Leisingera caerulea TaxID=506591 RepID=UPI0012B5B431|nr:hypothetical protein [Leisingera caerulea]
MNKLITLIVLLGLPSISFAKTDCFETLIQDVGAININDATHLALASAYSRSLDSSDKWAAGITVPIKGVPVDLTGEGQKRVLETVTSSFAAQFSSNRLVSMSTQKLSRNAVAAFDICMRGANRTGTVVYAFDATHREITVEVSWNASAGGPTEAPADIQVVNGEFTSALPDTFSTGTSYTTVVRREPGEDVRVIANIGGTSSNAVIYWVPTVKIETTRVTAFIDGPHSGKRWRLANMGDGREHSILGMCDYPPNGWSVVPGSASINISTRVGAIDHRTYARITEQTPDKVCFDGRVYPLDRHGGGDIWWRPSYQMEKVDVIVE